MPIKDPNKVETTATETVTTNVKDNRSKTTLLDQKHHKCVLIWNEVRMLHLYAGKRNGKSRFITVYPGVNTVDSEDVVSIYESNRAMFDQILSDGKPRIEFWGLVFKEDDEGQTYVVENRSLKKTSAGDLKKLIAKTVNRASLDDLSNPDYVTHINLAETRKDEIDSYVGIAPDIEEE